MNKLETDALKVITFIEHIPGDIADFFKKNGAVITGAVAEGQTILGDIGKVVNVLEPNSTGATAALSDANTVLNGITTAVAGAQTAADLQTQAAVAGQLAETIASVAVKNPVSQASLSAGVTKAVQIAGIIQAAAASVTAAAQAPSPAPASAAD